LSNDYYSDNMKPAEPNVNRRKIVLIGVILALLFPMLAVFVLTDFDRWQGQWRVWWGLTIADETAQTPAENVKAYRQDDEWVVTYQFSGINELGLPERFEHTEEVSESIVEKIEAKEGVLIDYVVGNPQIAGLETNHNPFSRFSLLLVLGGSMVMRLLPRMLGRRRRGSSLMGRIAEKSSPEETPAWMKPMSEPGNVERHRDSGMSRRLVIVLLFAVLLMIQLVVLVFLLL